MAGAVVPESFEAAASALAASAADGHRVRILGGQTKRGWGAVTPEPDLELHSHALGRIVEHNEGDLTAVLEAGVPLARAQQQFATAGQRLALDPWLGDEEKATIGGILATGDCGPLAHRYGSARDLVLGMTVALSDGTIARSGGKVIKNVAGYDIGKLFCGSFGTLGMILSVNLRLHPLPQATATAVGVSRDPARLAAAARELAARPFELESLDVLWREEEGRILARAAGSAPIDRVTRAADVLRSGGLDPVEVVPDDDEVWLRQRRSQRSASATLVKLAVRPSALAAVIEACRLCGGALVGRAGLGTSYVELEAGQVGRLRQHLPSGARSIVLDAPAELRNQLSVWGETTETGALELMRRVKARFDPVGACNPGLFVGGI